MIEEKMKNRLKVELKKHTIIFGIGFVYYLWVMITDIYIPCVFRTLTGFKCPGCGITHMLVAVSRFDFVCAFRENPLMFVCLPLWGISYGISRIYYIKTGEKLYGGKIVSFLEWSFVFLILIFWIVRNMYHI